MVSNRLLTGYLPVNDHLPAANSLKIGLVTVYLILANDRLLIECLPATKVVNNWLVTCYTTNLLMTAYWVI